MLNSASYGFAVHKKTFTWRTLLFWIIKNSSKLIKNSLKFWPGYAKYL